MIESGTRMQLIMAAERLFADRGIEGVSQREIAIAAGNGNTNAVKYHFGSKDDLVQGIFQMRVEQMEERRAAMLADADRQGRLEDPNVLMSILFAPLMDIVDEAGKHSCAAFINQYVVRYRPAGLQHYSDRVRDQPMAISRLLSLIRRRTAHLPDHITDSRMMLNTLAFTGMLVRWDSDLSQRLSPDDLASLAADTLEGAALNIMRPFNHWA